MENKNIVIVGVLDQPGSSNIWMATSFIKMGYNVIPINYRTILAEQGQDKLLTHIVEVMKKYQPLLTIFCKCNGVDPKTIEECSKFGKTFLFFMDLYKIAEQRPEIIEHAKNAHFSSCTSEITVEYFQAKGVPHCSLIFEGANPNVHKPVEPVNELLADISFITNINTPEKQSYYDALRKVGLDVKFYGPGYDNYGIQNKDGKLVTGEWAKIHSSSRMMLSMSTFNNVPTYFSGRLFESLACGVCTLHLDNTGTLTKYFTDNEEVVFFKDEKDLIEKIKSLTDIDCFRIAIGGREKVLHNYTWHHTVSHILKVSEN